MTGLCAHANAPVRGRRLAMVGRLACGILVAACRDATSPDDPTDVLEVRPASLGVFVGQPVRLVADAFDRDGDTVRTAGVRWSSSDSSVATVSAEGIVTGTSPGLAMIIARTTHVADSTAVEVTGWSTMSAGHAHSCGVTTSGLTFCWGANGRHQLGDSTVRPDSFPVAVHGPAGFATLSAGGRHSCARTADGAAYCWGYNFN
jgi:hypothetical protein